jgi:hypothetical protein
MLSFLKGFLVVASLAAILRLAGEVPFVGIFLLVCLLSLPLALVQSYRTSINSSIRALAFNPGGIIAGFLGRRFFKNVLYAGAAFVLAFSLLLNLASLALNEWVYAILAWPVFLVVFALFRRTIKKEVPAWLLNPYALLGALRIAPFLMILIYFPGIWYGGNVTLHLTPEAARLAETVPFANTDSQFLNRISDLMVAIEGYRDFAFGKIFKLNPWAWFGLTFVISWTFFYALSSLFVFVLIPKGELRRAWARPLQNGEISPPSFKRALFQIAVPFLGVFVLFFCLAVRAELVAMMSREDIAREICLRAENFRVRIGDELFDGEIVTAAIRHRKLYENLTKENKKKLLREIDRVFDGYKNNVDNYLDWYYSLQGDYARVGTMLVGEAETFMSDSLTTMLAQNINQEGVTTVLRELNQIMDGEKKSFEEIKEAYRIPCGVDSLPFLDAPKAQMNFSPQAFNRLTIPPDLFKLKIRLAVSGAVGLTGGILAGIGVKKVVMKIAQNVFFKSAAKTLVGVASKRAASVVGAGVVAGATGAAIGTGVAAGPGTAAGAVLGFGTGVLGAIVTDYLLLKVEEVLSRDNFRVSLISMLEIQRKEMVRAIENDDPSAALAPLAGVAP